MPAWEEVGGGDLGSNLWGRWGPNPFTATHLCFGDDPVREGDGNDFLFLLIVPTFLVPV